ncbi:M1 family metallopeptidase [Arcticibacter sp.]|uniref:M1 family metallopeptidase n=1 Tax=Arcticibacter sp. TaxID=1872630 RepID=UPI00388FB828
MHIRLSLSLLYLVFCGHVAQGQLLPIDRHTIKAYGNQTRDRSGLPGKAYWQNQGDYDIDVQFDPSSRKLTGIVHINYHNNSPDTLKSLSFKLYPNLYKANSMRNTVLSVADLGPGMHLSEMLIGGQKIDSNKRMPRGTNMSVRGLHILPGEQTSVKISYDYTLNKGSFNRTGQIDEGTFFLAYFFPRLTVYDDIDGWNEYNYLGKEEFYNDYGNFKVSVTVPREYCVWATGELTNTADIFEPTYIERIRNAEQQDSVTDVITKEDIKKGHITKAGSSHTWKFDARNVTDFAFALSRNYVWKSSSLVVDHATQKRTRVDAVYHPDHLSYTPVIEYNRKTVQLISESFPAIPFPYSHQTIIDGLDAMEYPMMVNNLPLEDQKDVVEFTAHEVFHSIFPFYVGTNETKHSFMDEGWATMTEFMFHPHIAPDIPFNYDLSSVNDYAGLSEDVPVMTPTAQLYGNARFADKDLKPALALWYLRDMVGAQKFSEATRYYIRAWAGKHPTPYDFFNCMNKGAGMDLNWYWKRWYFDKAVPDLSIDKVNKQNGRYHIHISNVGGAPVPVHLTVYFKNGTKQRFNKPVSIWKNSDKLDLALNSGSNIVRIVLGDEYDADTDSANNIWKTQQL